MRQFASLFLSLMLASCAWQGNRVANITPAEAVPAYSLANTESCVGELYATPAKDSPRLDSKQIRLLNWNTHKYADARAHDDLHNLGNEADLILLQEAIQGNTHIPGLGSPLHWEFAPGYIQAGVQTGVMTASTVAPVATCKLSYTEPWLRSPKATNINWYALSDTNETLLVINIHLINFTLGVSAMRTQLEQALAFVQMHSGPVIVSGDFNTWSKERSNVVTQALNELNLQPVKYSDDQRTRIFGLPVDHLYVRDIYASTATSHQVESSDHNPISVILKIL